MQRCFYLVFVIVLFNIYKISAQNELPYSSIDLTNLKNFKKTSGNWKVAGDVYYDLNTGGNGTTKPGTGILVNTPTEQSRDHLLTNFEHGDMELELEFMMDKGSNAGVYLQGRYEIQMFDSWGELNPKVTDCGAIYQRWDESRPEGSKGYEGHPPAQNVSRAPGLWQHFRIVFQAPRFNSKGEKIQNAKFVEVIHNGVTIHQNIELTGPTRASAFNDEKPFGPLMIQGDHGPVAIRNIRYKSYGIEEVSLSDLKLKFYDGQFKSPQDLNSATPKGEMNLDLLAHSAPGGKDKFGGNITGSINLPKTGKYIFTLNLKWIPDEVNPSNINGAGELIIGNKKILTLNGSKGGTATATVEMKAGKYPLSLLYYKNFGFWYARSNDILLSVEGPGIAKTFLKPVLAVAQPVGQIKISAGNAPVMQRGFMNHKGVKRTHVIAVGEPGAANYTFDLLKGEFLQVWRGDFLETTPMWHERGETQLSLPMGSVIEFSAKPSLAFLSDKNAAWPDSNATYKYDGYEVEKGRPVFKYNLDGANIKESFVAEDGGKRLSHIIEVDKSGNKTLWNIVAEGKDIEQLPNGLYAVNNKQYYVELTGVDNAVIRTSANNQKELIVPIVSTTKYAIIW